MSEQSELEKAAFEFRGNALDMAVDADSSEISHCLGKYKGFYAGALWLLSKAREKATECVHTYPNGKIEKEPTVVLLSDLKQLCGQNK